MEELPIIMEDLEDTRQVIAACIGYFTAQDMARAQQQFSRMRKSALTVELERVKDRLDGVLGDFLLAKHESEREPEEEVFPVEELDNNPLGSKLPAGQKGTRLVPKYLQTEDSDVEDYTEEDETE